MPDVNSVCRISGDEFLISEIEQELCRKFAVPLPTTHPRERMRHVLSFSNLSRLYRSSCSATGKKILSIFRPGVAHPVYETPYWWSDEWDAISYGRGYDFQRSFFGQFAELQKVVPQMSLLINYATVENSDYLCGAGYCRNCYLLFNANNNEDCYFSYTLHNSTDCIDCTAVQSSELCYDCTFVEDGYNLRHSFNSKNCSDSAFLWNCIGCKDCFCCSNLRHQRFCFLNEQLTEEVYRQRISEIQLGSYQTIEQWRERFIEFAVQSPQPAIRGLELENADGDFISHCQNVANCFEGWELQDCANCLKLKNAKDCLDLYSWGADIELVCRTSRCGYNSQNVLCSWLIYMNSTNIEYSMNCVSSAHCFGCIGLRNKSYCILNKQYKKDEYFELRERIITQMKDPSQNKGLPTYGEFFPYELSLFPFNDSDAMIHLPLSREAAEQRGARWDDDESESVPENFDWNTVADRIAAVDKGILDQTLVCQETNKPYRITTKEFEAYKARGIPIPRLHWRARMNKRQKLLNVPETFSRECAKTGQAIRTSFPQDSPWQVWENSAYTKQFE